MKKPNILFFFSDQQRWDTLGCYGQKLPVTPHLDKLAKEGVLFENAFTCQPVCGPARACIQTGVFATQNGCYRNRIALPIEADTIAKRLNAIGYETAYVGKWHLASDDVADYRATAIPPERRGGYKDYWVASDLLEFTSQSFGGHLFNGDMEQVNFEGYRVDAVTDFALDYLKQWSGEKPFFLFVSHLEPHHQNDMKQFVGPEDSKEKWKDYEMPGDLDQEIGDSYAFFEEYLGACHSLDNNFGRVWEYLEERGVADDTLIVYTSDHGCHFRTRNKEYKRSLHEASVHIPMIIRGPGFMGGKIEQELVSLLNLPPTLMKTAGASVDGYVAKPLQDLLAGDNDWAQEVFIQISESEVGRALRTKQWKYGVTGLQKEGSNGMNSDVYVESALYDLSKDSHELDNLIDDISTEDIRNELRQKLIHWMVKAGESVPQILQKSDLQSNEIGVK